jgi:hypothetical protein
MEDNKRNKDITVVGQARVREPKLSLPERAAPEVSFDSWWLRTQKKFDFKPEMKEIVWKHFNARGFIKNRDFEAGLKDFGV